MNLFLGNIQFNQVEDMLGYKLTDSDKDLWDQFHSQSATLDKNKECFHVFDIPRCIKFRGSKCGEAILKMFVSEKITNPIGQFQVYEIE